MLPDVSSRGSLFWLGEKFFLISLVIVKEYLGIFLLCPLVVLTTAISYIRLSSQHISL